MQRYISDNTELLVSVFLCVEIVVMIVLFHTGTWKEERK